MAEQESDPARHASGDANGNQVRRPTRSHRAGVRVPCVDEILQQLVQLNGAVAIGAMSTKEANLIQKNLKTVLDVQVKRASRDDTGPSQEALAELCRNDPQMPNVIAPFLTDSQFDLILNEVTEDQQ